MGTTDHRLPAPAAALWRKVRDLFSEALRERAGGAPYSIGGGTVLALRWGHRESEDVDLTMDEASGPERLNRLRQPGWLTKIAALGGEVRPTRDASLFTASFGSQRVDVWAKDPKIRKGEQTVVVEGRAERLLSTAQIVAGKLERGEDLLARDVLDVCEAAERDPESLEAAVNREPPEWINHVAGLWAAGNAHVAADARTTLRGLSGDCRRRLDTLGKRAAAALRDALYVDFDVVRNGPEVTVFRKTAGGAARRATMPASAAEALGFDDYVTMQERQVPQDRQDWIGQARPARAERLIGEIVALWRERNGVEAQRRTLLPSMAYEGSTFHAGTTLGEQVRHSILRHVAYESDDGGPATVNFAEPSLRARWLVTQRLHGAGGEIGLFASADEQAAATWLVETCIANGARNAARTAEAGETVRRVYQEKCRLLIEGSRQAP